MNVFSFSLILISHFFHALNYEEPVLPGTLMRCKQAKHIFIHGLLNLLTAIKKICMPQQEHSSA